MEKIHTFCVNAITNGRTVLIYKGVTATKAKHVKTAERLTFVGGIMYCDGQSTKGMTICLKP